VIWEILAAICYFMDWEYYWTKREKKANALENTEEQQAGCPGGI